MSSLADRYLDGLLAEKSIEHALYEFMETQHDWTMFGDAYDHSLEVFVPTWPVERVADLGAFVLSLGFDRCWIHLHEGDRDNCGPGRCQREHSFLKTKE